MTPTAAPPRSRVSSPAPPPPSRRSKDHPDAVRTRQGLHQAHRLRRRPRHVRAIVSPSSLPPYTLLALRPRPLRVRTDADTHPTHPTACRMRGRRACAVRGGHVQPPADLDPDLRSRSRSAELAARPRRCSVGEGAHLPLPSHPEAGAAKTIASARTSTACRARRDTRECAGRRARGWQCASRSAAFARASQPECGRRCGTFPFSYTLRSRPAVPAGAAKPCIASARACPYPHPTACRARREAHACAGFVRTRLAVCCSRTPICALEAPSLPLVRGAAVWVRVRALLLPSYARALEHRRCTDTLRPPHADGSRALGLVPVPPIRGASAALQGRAYRVRGLPLLSHAWCSRAAADPAGAAHTCVVSRLRLPCPDPDPSPSLYSASLPSCARVRLRARSTATPVPCTYAPAIHPFAAAASESEIHESMRARQEHEDEICRRRSTRTWRACKMRFTVHYRVEDRDRDGARAGGV
ncbi:hypothetical protein B0H17DRAFT_1222186 [Mycena rosella]|uniref:Uncharacterized protein n=1 Tax=Mycena rosella TaxID=1033263 RepID=A0AAD7F6D9_MYCRO|nr:hypothetical protein B0H17DRAFT_1222186 [Mycena rosella]